NIKNFQGDKAGTGSSSYDDLKAEFSEIAFTPGVVGMARSRYIHSANSQFFIMAETQSGLNGQYTVIGMVSEGLDIVRSIKNGSKAQNGKVSRPDIIKTAVIVQ
ncbi:MAG: peptidylprolyl isomerase, partial [Kiritimatiellia bacterium]